MEFQTYPSLEFPRSYALLYVITYIVFESL